jgi:hypothetical protein
VTASRQAAPASAPGPGQFAVSGGAAWAWVWLMGKLVRCLPKTRIIRNGFVLRVSQHATAFRRGGAGADGFAAGLIAAIAVTA